MSADARKRYFDANFDKQVRAFPKKWMDASRFKVGDRIEFLAVHLVQLDLTEGTAAQVLDLNGQIGIVENIRHGRGSFPPRWISDGGGGFWDGESAGWLTVRFPFDSYGREEDGRYKPRACCLTDEGRRWRKAS